ncbi:hypothetical protein HFO33_06705 [Rhizobium leguminosarum]|uniref:hypothetical protein n=1 Tax=Rhizobium leguminosarum TaxID=384 RepID=UPI001C949A34|nr:hypothetical protein [Rhizobium leguminosarum]MBY5716282.1 hypothetical protein [Rhizobium leguminosarum]
MKIGNLYAYRINPIDFGWEYLRSAESHRKQLATAFAEQKNSYERDDALKAINEFENLYNAAMDAGHKVGWEGDFRIEPCVGFLPAEVSLAIYLVWKQDNNGDTFVVSPMEMAWLEEISL